VYIHLDKDGIMMLGSKTFDVDNSDHIIINGDMLAHRVFTNLFSKEFPTCIRKTINENTKVYCWIQTHIDAITPCTVIYEVTEDISIDIKQDLISINSAKFHSIISLNIKTIATILVLREFH